MDPRYQCLGLGPGWSWRLLGSNHRALARAAGTFTTMDDAGADALWIGERAAQAGIEIVTTRGSTWRWELTVDGMLRVTCVVPYARRLECVRAVARFRECAPLAAVSPVPLVRRPGSGRAQHVTAQHVTAQHVTAQHVTAPPTTAPPSTALSGAGESFGDPAHHLPPAG